MEAIKVAEGVHLRSVRRGYHRVGSITKGEVYIHIGVGSNVVCSTTMGNARASESGIDNRTIPRFFCALMKVIVNLKTHDYEYWHTPTNGASIIPWH